jgi:hypothetical protein
MSADPARYLRLANLGAGASSRSETSFAISTIIAEPSSPTTVGAVAPNRIGGLVQLTVRVKPAQKKRRGRNPVTGEEIEIAAKPASVDVRARPLAKAKAALPSVQKARRRLAS